ncbi:MAG: 30S ribosomal protein S7 [Patescibacteria group bacterium]
MRRPLKEKQKHPVTPDRVYDSVTTSKLVNYVMKGGEKNAARKVVHGAFEEMKKEGVTDPAAALEEAIRNVAPAMEVRSRRVGGANYQVPFPVRPERQLALALRWILEGARGKKGATMAHRLAQELMAAKKGEGEAMKKRENMHRMAEANKAFAHFAFNRTQKK